MQNFTFRQLLLLFIFTFGITAESFSQDTIISNTRQKNWKIFAEADLGLLALTGGVSTFAGLRQGPHSFEAGFQHFESPKGFGGTPEAFDLKVGYIYSLHYSYFWNGKTDKGFYSRLMYHNKKQTVTEKSSGISKNLYSDLVGLELGYVIRLYKGLYITPRLGALYYLKSPQGKDNHPVAVGNDFYDNGRHKTWDTYFIPTVSVGYSFPVKR